MEICNKIKMMTHFYLVGLTFSGDFIIFYRARAYRPGFFSLAGYSDRITQ